MRKWNEWKLVDETRSTLTSAGEADLRQIRTVADMFSEREKERLKRQQQKEKLKNEDAKIQESNAPAQPALNPSAIADLLLLHSHCLIDLPLFLHRFHCSRYNFRVLPDLVFFLKRKWDQVARERRRVYGRMCAEEVPLFLETCSKIASRMEVQRQEKQQKEAREEELAKIKQQTLAEITGRMVEGAQVDLRSTDIQTPKVRRANRRGSMVGNLLTQWPLDAKAKDGGATNGDVAASESGVRFAVENPASTRPSSAHPSSVAASNIAPPWFLTHRIIHELMMRVGEHTRFYVQALIEQALADETWRPFQSATAFTNAIERTAEATCRAASNFIFDLHTYSRLVEREGKAIDPQLFDYSSVPAHVLQQDISSGPAHPLLSAELISELGGGAHATGMVQQLFYCSEDLTPYTLFFHLTHLSNPHQIRSAPYQIYRDIREGSMPFTSWLALEQAVRECQTRWMQMREEVHSFLNRHQYISFTRRHSAASTLAGASNVAAFHDTTIDPTFVSVLGDGVPSVTLADVDEILMKSNIGLDAMEWLRSYEVSVQTHLLSPTASASPAAKFADLEALQAQLAADGFASLATVADARSAVLSSLSSYRDSLFLSTVQIGVRDLDDLLLVVLGEKDLKSFESPQGVLTLPHATSVSHVCWVIQYLVSLPRSYESWSQFLSGARWIWQEMSTVVRRLIKVLNEGAGRKILGFLGEGDMLSEDGVRRLAMQSGAGIYTLDLVNAILEGSSPSVLAAPVIVPSPPVPAGPVTTKRRRKSTIQPSHSTGIAGDSSSNRPATKTPHTTIAEELRVAEVQANAIPVFGSLDELIHRIGVQFSSTVLPSFHSMHASLRAQLSAYQAELFHSLAEDFVWTQAHLWALFDLSTGRMETLRVIRSFHEDFRQVRDEVELREAVKEYVESERKDRKILVELLNDPSTSLLRSSTSSPLPLPSRLIDRVITQGRCSPSRTRALVELWTQEGKTVPSLFDLILVLRETADKREEEEHAVRSTIRSYLQSSSCYLLPKGMILKERHLKQLLKVAGSVREADLCLALLQYMNTASAPITTTHAAPVDSTDERPRPVTSSSTSSARLSLPLDRSERSAPEPTAVPALYQAFDSLAAALGIAHRATLAEVELVVDFFVTARPAQSDVDREPSNELEDRCKLWTQSWRQGDKRGPLFDYSNDTLLPVPTPAYSSTGESSGPVPVIDLPAAMRMIIESGTCTHAMTFLLHLNHYHPYSFSTPLSIAVALKNVFLRWIEAKRQIGVFLDSEECILLPHPQATGLATKRTHVTTLATTAGGNDAPVPATQGVTVADAERAARGPITMKQIDRLLTAYGHSLMHPHYLHTFLRTLQAQKLQLHLNPRENSLGMEQDEVQTAAATSSTIVFSTVKELATFLREDALASELARVVSESTALLSDPSCMLLRGPFVLEGEHYRANVVVTASDVAQLASVSGAGVFLLRHLRRLQQRRFECTTLAKLQEAIKERIHWDGLEGIRLDTAQ